MKHRVAGKKLSRSRNQRKALFKNLINALVIKGEIKTTESKAKAVRGLVDKLITRGKTGTLQARRMIGAFLQNKQAVHHIIDELGPLFKTRAGGFTRMGRLGRRRGDDAMMVKLELVEKPKAKEEKSDRKKKSQKAPKIKEGTEKKRSVSSK
jgi:large subunit ribosomal protein L17